MKKYQIFLTIIVGLASSQATMSLGSRWPEGTFSGSHAGTKIAAGSDDQSGWALIWKRTPGATTTVRAPPTKGKP
jgi:hypothetical protein